MTQAEWTFLASTVIAVLSALGSGFWAWRISRSETTAKQTGGWEAQYRRDYEALKMQLAEAQARERALHAAETADLRRSVTGLQQELKTLRRDYTALRADHNRLRTAHGHLQAHLDAYETVVRQEPDEGAAILARVQAVLAAPKPRRRKAPAEGATP